MARSAVLTIFFTDLVGSTDMHARLGDEVADALVAKHTARVRAQVEGHDGSLVKFLGDGVLATFRSARRALACAVAIQQGELAESEPLGVRVGLAAGEVIERQGDVHGLAVATAARIVEHARGDEILATDLVRQLAGVDPSLRYVDRGLVVLRGLPDPIPLTAVEWGGPVGEPIVEEHRLVVDSDPFVGRVVELAELRNAFDAAERGHGSVVLLAGEPGIGKTRLADAIADHARGHNASVLWGECWEGDGAPAFWPWSRALGSELDDAPDELRRLLTGEEPTEQRTDELRFRAFNQLADLLEARGGERPILLVLDDLHWADRSSLELLRVVSRRAGRARCLVIGTFRDVDVGHDHPLHELGGDAKRVQLAGLGAAEVVELVTALRGIRPTASAVTELVHRTDGNPFFVRELSRSGDEQSLPAGVRDMLRRRLDRLDGGPRDVLTVAGLIGRVDVPLLAEVAGIPLETVLDALDQAARVGLVRRRTGGHVFVHALVRETIVDGLSIGDRAKGHLRIAQHLDRAGTGEPSEVADHYARARPLAGADDVVRCATAAGRFEHDRFAYEEAVRWYDTALGALAATGDRRRAELLLNLADAHRRTGQDKAPGMAACQEVTVIARRLGDPELLARAAIAHCDQVAFGFLEFAWGGDPAMLALVEEALSTMAPDPSPSRVGLLVRVARLVAWTSSHDRGVEVANEAVAMARLLGDRNALVEALSATATLTSFWDDEQPTLVDELEAQAGDAREAMTVVLVARIGRAVATWDRPGADRSVRHLAQVLDDLHVPTLLCQGPLHRAMLLRFDGAYIEAEAVILATIGELSALGSGSVIVTAMNQLFVVYYEQDRLAEMVESARALLGPGGTQSGLPAAPAVLAFVEAQFGEPATGARLLRSVLDAWGAVPDDNNRGLAWLLLARSALYLGDLDAAGELYAIGRPWEAYGIVTGAASVTLGSIAVGLAELALALGRLDDADRHLSLAEQQYRQFRARGYLVECRYLRAALRHAQGDTATASDLARAGQSEAEALGMARVARLCGELLDDLAARPVPVASTQQRDAPPSIGNVFRREGDVWLLSFAGASVRLRDSKGLCDLAMLLARPGREVHVAELVGVGETFGSGTSGDVRLDDRAIAAYKARLAELADDQDEADTRGDIERSARVAAERDALVERLAADLGLGGRSRSADDWAERARKAVRTRIASTLKRIEAEHAALGRHLRASIRTGAFCSYDPPEPTQWEL